MDLDLRKEGDIRGGHKMDEYILEICKAIEELTIERGMDMKILIQQAFHMINEKEKFK